MDKRERKQRLLGEIARLIDGHLILDLDRLEIHTLVGIKNSLNGILRCSDSHEESVERIKLGHLSESFPISEFDRLRLKHIILPRMGDYISGWDSASREVSYDTALDLFEADLEYLRSDDLSRFLPASCTAARAEVEANIRTTRLHSRFGTGSKVSYRQYQRLVLATAGGWSDHLVELGALAPREQVYELGFSSQWRSDESVDDQDDTYFEHVAPELYSLKQDHPEMLSFRR